jgi:CSLREA domain-containing protein
VTSLDDPGDGTCDASCTLRDAIQASQTGAKISFASELSGTIVLTGGQLQIVDKSISIDGGKRITVDAQGNSRVVLINDAAKSGTLVVKLAGMVIKNGTTTGVFDRPTAGGGIMVDGGDVTLTARFPGIRVPTVAASISLAGRCG